MDTAVRQLRNFQAEMLEFVQPFFSRHKIRFFGYSRTYEDQTCFWLSTHPAVYEYLLKHQLPLNAPQPSDHIEPFYYHYTPPSADYFDMTYDITAQFQLHHPLDLVFRRNGYYELFCLAVDREDRDILNYYLNNINHFKQFCVDFTGKASHLIKSAQQQTILLPDEMYQPVSNLIVPAANNKMQTLTWSNLMDALMAEETRSLPFLETAKRYTLHSGSSEIQLTKRELECLLCLLKGKSAKASADALFIDRRTVETYIDRLKRATQTDSKLMLTTHIYRSLLQSMGLMEY